eukprot:g3529.t1
MREIELQNLANDTMEKLPLQEMRIYVAEAESRLREEVLKQIPKFLFQTESDASACSPRDCTPKQWREWLSNVQSCMPVQHVVVDLREKRAYDWGLRCRETGGDYSRLTNLWNALALCLDPYPYKPETKFTWRTYFHRSVDAEADSDPTEEVDAEELAKWLNSQYYRILAEFMPACSRADPDLLPSEESRIQPDSSSSKYELDLDAEFDLRYGALLPLDDHDEHEKNVAALVRHVIEDWKIVHDLHLDLGLPDTDPEMQGDMDVEEYDPTLFWHQKDKKTHPSREDARMIYWTLIGQLLRFPSKADAVKQSLAEMATKFEPIARKNKTTVIHRNGHQGALLRMTSQAFDYNLLQTGARGVLDYVDLFQVDINFQLAKPWARFYAEPPQRQTIMTHISDYPAIVIALMKHGAKPPPFAAETRSLAEMARDGQNIHASESTAALVTLSEAAMSFLQERGVEAFQKMSNVIDELRTRIKRLSPEDFASLRKAEKHAQELSSDEEDDASFLILKALCQAAHQYDTNRQTCDPVLLVINVLTGRVTDEDIQQEAQKNPKNDEAAADRLTVPRNFLAQLQELHGAKTWHILEEGQRRLFLLPQDDQKTIPELFDRIINSDGAEHATNCLRGLFVQQIMDDLGDTLTMKYGHGLDDLPNMPRELSQMLMEVYEIAEKFTKLFLSGDHMQAAFEPFLSAGKLSAGQLGKAGVDRSEAKVDEGDEGGSCIEEPNAKRQKTGRVY